MTDCLILYNENVEQFRDKTDLRLGGGNAVMRPLRVDHDLNSVSASVSSLGIPTMLIRRSIASFDVDSPIFIELKEEVVESLKQIERYLDNHKNTRLIIFSSDENFNLGMQIAVSGGFINFDQMRSIQNLVKTALNKLASERGFDLSTFPSSLDEAAFINILKGSL